MKKLIQLIVLSFISFNVFASEISTIAVIDAGSSGSRIHVYQYQNNDNGLPKLTEIYNQKAKPGLSSYANDPADAGTSLAPMLNGAKEAINQAGGSVAATPLYLYATAGMRLLPQAQQAAIYQQVRDELKQFDFNTKEVRTIPGWEEGIFGWITINDLMGNFNGDSAHNTQGVLDLGGASAEITYHSDEANPNTHPFTLAGKNYSVFAYSFLNLGSNEALKHLSDFGNLASCFPKGYHYSVNGKDGEGQFDYALCRSETDNEVASFDIPNIKPALVSDMIYAALSSFYYTFDFFHAGSSQAALAKHAQSLCSQDWSAIKAQYPNVPDEYLSGYCFNAAFELSLLGEKGYGFSADHPQLNVENDVKGQDVDWTVGAAIYLISGEGLS